MTGKWKQKFWICWLKQYSQPESREFFYLVEMFNTLSPGDRFPVALKKTVRRRQEGKSGYTQVCNKGSSQSEYQRSGIKLRNLAF